MPLFMDIHRNVKDLTPDAVKAAHQKDLEVGKTHGVHYTHYWFNEKAGTVMCLCEAPNADAAAAVHREGHGLVADEIIEVHQGG